MVNAGQLNSKCAILRATATRDAAGAETRIWATLQYAWAAIESLSGRETEIAHATEAIRSHKVTLRYIDGNNVLSTDRISYGGKTYEITSPATTDTAKKYVTIYVNEIE